MFDINKTIKRVLIYFPIFRPLLNNIKFIEDRRKETASTNGRVIYYNSEFFETLTKDESAAVIVHELMHIALRHITRMNGRDIEKWNYATDAVINQIIKKNGLKIIDGGIDCPDALNYSAEEYYEIISNDPNFEETLKKYCNDEKNKAISTHKDWNKQITEEIIDEIEKNFKDINEHNISDKNREKVKQENEEFKNNIEQKKQTSIIDNVENTKPIINWKIYLENRCKNIKGSDYNLSNGKFNRSGIYEYPIELIYDNDVEILIDTSGSVDDTLVKTFLSECNNIFRFFNIKIGCFDTKFYGFQTFKNGKNISDIKIDGRGGTDFNVAINAFSKKSSIKIIFTDGYSKMPDYCKDVIWIVYGDTKINPPGGIVFMVDSDTLRLSGKNR